LRGKGVADESLLEPSFGNFGSHHNLDLDQAPGHDAPGQKKHDPDESKTDPLRVEPAPNCDHSHVRSSAGAPHNRDQMPRS
jgi:hypothetical protein